MSKEETKSSEVNMSRALSTEGLWQPTPLPIKAEVESKVVLRKTAVAHRRLAELKGKAETIPREKILIDTLFIQEAKESSEVENIVTTHDELFRSRLDRPKLNVATKEVRNYVAALDCGFHLIEQHDILTSNHIIAIQKELEKNNAGFRTQPGTRLTNERTGETIYIPPQHPDRIVELMRNLENYINDDSLSDLDPLIKMAILHFQFESIHPFFDGNGRTGRIINILYLVLKDLLRIPVLYLSRYINQHKAEYYRYLQDVRDNGNWEMWILFMLDAVEQTAGFTTLLIGRIKDTMQEIKRELREKFPSFYSQDLLNHLFLYPYTQISILMKSIGVSRPTASGYLNKLAKAGIVNKIRHGRSNYYVNHRLLDLLVESPELPISIP